MEEKLNKLLADFTVETHKIQNFHWYVKGDNFFNDHLKLEEYYNAFNKYDDEIAEVMLMDGFKPKATLRNYVAGSSIEEAKNEFVKARDVYSELAADFAYLLDEVEEVKKMADDYEDYLVSNKMDMLIEDLSKYIWMIKQLLMD